MKTIDRETWDYVQGDHPYVDGFEPWHDAGRAIAAVSAQILEDLAEQGMSYPTRYASHKAWVDELKFQATELRAFLEGDDRTTCSARGRSAMAWIAAHTDDLWS